jgi:hypothetical protein
MKRFLGAVVLVAVAVLLASVVEQRVAQALLVDKAGGQMAAYTLVSSMGPQHGASVSLNGTTEAVFTGTAGSCYSINTEGKDIRFYVEDATNTGTASVTDHRLPDPGIQNVCLLPSQTKIHFFASVAATATVAQVGP